MRIERRSIPMRVACRRLLAVAVGLVLFAPQGVAQAPAGYGASITLEDAKRVGAAAVAEARRNGWNVAIAVVDISGNLVYYEKIDDTSLGAANVSLAKARSAALFRRPSKAFQDALAAGGEGLRVLALEGAIPVEGGVPIVVGGRIVGAIGVSGVTSQQDGVIAAAGAGAVK